MLPCGTLILPLFGPSGGYAVKGFLVAILVVLAAAARVAAGKTHYRYKCDVYPLVRSADRVTAQPDYENRHVNGTPAPRARSCHDA